MRGLFIGGYPNEVEPYRCVFFREFVHACARQGIECYVIAPVSVTHYKLDSFKINYHVTEKVENGKDVEVYHPHIITYSAKKIGNYNTIHLTMKSMMSSAFSVYKKLDMKFDFIYGHFFLNGGLIASKLGETYGVPAYVAYGECDYYSEVQVKYGDIKPEELSGIHGIISVSTNNTNDLKSRSFTKGIPIFTCLNAVDSDIFYKMDKAECRKALGMPDKEFIVGFVGYFIDRKGHRRLMAACEGLDGVHLAFAGKGEDKPVGDNVCYCCSLEHKDVAVFLNAVDAFVLPTLNEGCCNAVIEALACGKAIVSSDLPFNHDVLNSENSILVDPQNIGQIREAIVTLRDNKEKRSLLEQNALETAKDLSIEARAQKILGFINSEKEKENA